MEMELDFDQLTKDLEKYASLQAEDTKEIENTKARISALSSQLSLLMKEKTELENRVTKRKTLIQTGERALVKAARLKEIQEEQKRIESEFKAQAERLNELTKDAVWRGRAFDYQIEGGQRLAIAKRGILGDKRGLGKTLTSIIWADSVQAKRMLIIAPNDVVDQFAGEMQEWAPNRTLINASGWSKSQRQILFQTLSILEEFAILINYEAWRMDKSIIDEMIGLQLDSIMLDEAHRIKAHDKQTARGVTQIVYRPNYCAACSEYVDSGSVKDGEKFIYWSQRDKTSHCCEKCGDLLTNTIKNVLCMSGTPILNKPQELFALLHLVNYVAFPTEGKFVDDFCYMDYNNRWTFTPGGLKKLKETMSSFFLQRDRDAVGIHIPPPAINVYRLDRDVVKYAKQYAAEKEITEKSSMLLDSGERKDIFFILELILRQRQVMTWPSGIELTDPETKQVIAKVDVQESQKLDAATDLLKELLEEGERVIVFSQFKAPLYEMERRLKSQGYRPAMATGDQTKGYKTVVMRDFDLKTAPEKPQFDVCLATYKAFGTGINLNAARHLIILDDEWNPGNEDQAIGRIDRINSVDQANVHIFRINKSVDDFMEKILEEKRGITSGFSAAMDADKLATFFGK